MGDGMIAFLIVEQLLLGALLLTGIFWIGRTLERLENVAVHLAELSIKPPPAINWTPPKSVGAAALAPAAEPLETTTVPPHPYQPPATVLFEDDAFTEQAKMDFRDFTAGHAERHEKHMKGHTDRKDLHAPIVFRPDQKARWIELRAAHLRAEANQ